MKLMEAIRKIDELKHNTFSIGDKIAWLSALDGNIKKVTHDTHFCETKEAAMASFVSHAQAKWMRDVEEYQKIHDISFEAAQIAVEKPDTTYVTVLGQIKLSHPYLFFNGYTEKEVEVNDGPQLLVPAPWDELYLYWLEAQIDYYNGEYARYNNSATRFTRAFQDYCDYYNRTHKPLTPAKSFH